MNSNAAFFKKSVTLRITALWAFSEAFVGGILHGLKIPFAGLVPAFVASVCITLSVLGNIKEGRAVVIILAWKFFIAPLLQIQVQKWVDRYKKKNGHTLQKVFALLPEIKIILQQSWQLSHKPTSPLRVKDFLNNAVLLIVQRG